MANRWNPELCCTRCHKPILSEVQACFYKGQPWKCIPPSDQTVIEADGLLLKTGDNYGKRVQMPDDPYAPPKERE